MAAMLDDELLIGGNGLFDPTVADDDRLAGPGVDHDYRLTKRGLTRFEQLGIDVRALPRQRPLIRYCVDWSEQRHHLAGALGAALATRLFELRWIRRAPAGRAVLIADDGYHGLRETFGVVLNGS
jgi:hypothetical protein